MNDINLCSFILGLAFHRLSKPSLPWFAWVTPQTQAQTITHMSCQCLNCNVKGQFSKCCFVKRLTRLKICILCWLWIWEWNLNLFLFDNQNSKWTSLLEVNKTVVNFKSDSDAQANIIPFQPFKPWKECSKLKPSRFKLLAFYSTNIPAKDCCILKVTLKCSTVPILFNVVKILILDLKTSACQFFLEHFFLVKNWAKK